MTIRHLRIFSAVAECGTMHAAARKLYLAQPAISTAISELEKHYHVKLFERLSKKLYITSEGKQFLFYANHILSLFNELEQQMNNSSAQAELKIGATITIGTCIIHHILNEFYTFYPNANVQVYDEMILVCSPVHPFARTGQATLEEISLEKYIAREPSVANELFVEYMSLHNLSVRYSWFCNNSETTKQAVANNYGVTVISRRIVAQELKSGALREVNIKDCQLIRKFQMLYHKNKFFSNPLLDLMDLCRNLDVTLPE